MVIWGDLTKNGLGRMGKDDEEYGLYCLTSTEYYAKSLTYLTPSPYYSGMR